jgi:hypothetical protein
MTSHTEPILGRTFLDAHAACATAQLRDLEAFIDEVHAEVKSIEREIHSVCALGIQAEREFAAIFKEVSAAMKAMAAQFSLPSKLISVPVGGIDRASHSTPRSPEQHSMNQGALAELPLNNNTPLQGSSGGRSKFGLSYEAIAAGEME